MATSFKINQPVKTTANFVDVQNNLDVGTHTFQLIVVDDQGNASSPVKGIVRVIRPLVPVPTPAPAPAPPTSGSTA
jgi:hypothetical protein